MTLELTLSFLAIAAPAVVLAGLSKGGFASGADFAAIAILALFLPFGQVLGLMLPLLLVMDLVNLRAYWRKWDPVSVWLLLPGSVLGVALGALLLRWVDQGAVQIMIGTLAVAFVLWRAAVSLRLIGLTARPVPRWAGPLAGALGGFTSFVAHAGGPVTSVFLLMRGLSKNAFQGTTVLFYWLVNLMKVGAYSALGLLTWDTGLVSLALVPFAIVGVVLGVVAHKHMSESAFLPSFLWRFWGRGCGLSGWA